MLKFFFTICLIKFTFSNVCNDALVNTVFDNNFNANYYLCIPALVRDSSYSLIIKRNNFKNYMSSLDIKFKNNDTLASYLKEVLNRTKKFTFFESACRDIIGIKDFQLISNKKKKNFISKIDKTGFLKRYLVNYDPNQPYFNLNTDFSPTDYYSIINRLFSLNYLVVEGDGVISVLKIDCGKIR